jgi:nitric-oxide synthase
MPLLFRAVKFTSKLFGRALSRRIKATVLYATETGKSEMYAKKLGEIFGHAFNSQVGLSFQHCIPEVNSARLVLQKDLSSKVSSSLRC